MERVLLIDDESDALEVLQWMFSDLGCEVLIETDAHRALELAAQFNPSLVLADYLLSGDLTGVDVIRRLRQQYPSLRAILMTGMMANDIREEVAALSGVEVLRKPFVWKDLAARLNLETRSCA